MDRLGIKLKPYINYLNSHNIKIAQYRNKVADKQTIYKDLEIIKSIYKGSLILNDYIEYIDLADGLHIGQEDLTALSSNFESAVKLLRKKIGNKVLGLSTHNSKEVEVANSLDLDYIGLGAYRATTTKKSVQISGLSLLEIAKKSKHKVALIGGVTIDDNFTNYQQISYSVVGSNLMQHFLQNECKI